MTLVIGAAPAVSWHQKDFTTVGKEEAMNDLDDRRAERDVRSHLVDVSRPSRYADVLNRYLGAAGHPAGVPAPVPRMRPAVAPTGVVLVGADETPAGCTVVDHAAIEAELRGWDLRILHAQQGRTLSSSRDAGARLLRGLTDRVHAGSSSVAVNCRLVVGSAASLLLAEARATDLLVVGSRRSATSAALGLSVADRLAGSHEGVILVVRIPDHPPESGFGQRPVVAGVEQRGVLTPAARFALLEAQLRGCELVLVSAHHGPAPVDRTETVDGVVVRHRTEDADPVAALTDFSQRAAALVVGRRAFGGHPVTMLGSVSRAVIQRAACPVFLV